MKAENQVCSLELAKKLKALGIKQDAYFCYVQYGVVDDYDHEQIVGTLLGVVAAELHDDNASCIISSAFTAAELGQILPNNIVLPDGEPFDNYKLYINKFNSVNQDRSINNNYIINYECDSTAVTGEEAWLRRRLTVNIYDPNLADAMAKMLIYLIENKLMEITHVEL